MLLNSAMGLTVFHGKNKIEKSEKCTKKRDSRREKRDLDFSLSQCPTNNHKQCYRMTFSECVFETDL